MFFIRQLYESFLFALQSFKVNKTRTMLSLLGITIGIFAIISVFTGVDSMSHAIHKNVESMGKSTAYITKWPWSEEEESGGGEYQWWKYMNRPYLRMSEYSQLLEYMEKTTEYSCMSISFSRGVSYQKNFLEGASITGATYEYDKIQNLEIERGRYFTPYEAQSGQAEVIIGATIAESLFEEDDPIGKTMKVGRRKAKIIGILKKEGENMFGSSHDEVVIMPFAFATRMINLRWSDPQIAMRARMGVDFENYKAEITMNLRKIRRLSPEADNTFSVNEISAITNRLEGLFTTLTLVGGIIGLFSILVGGFGVANIMFVTVKERTSQIGIMKALGAKRYTILSQFIFEAILLSMAGGIIGLLLIWIGTKVTAGQFDFDLILTASNISLGLGISTAVGAISGIFPAWSAARMEPVKAIYNSN